ncbi:hypothetical protein T01_11805 [Trichinella spiralis]|uniref:Uncharacterized protein n=1 Tax=Trichinella spiralis TaxID=6334 RepID=A0A0V1AM26_TRISP|nr:hypothetical protein T01_11805 [Trichinella spiralis]
MIRTCEPNEKWNLKNRALRFVLRFPFSKLNSFEIDNIGIIEKCEDFKRKSSEEQNYPKSTRTELPNLCQSQFGAICRIEDFKRKSSKEQNYSKSTRTELQNLCQSQFGVIRRM